MTLSIKDKIPNPSGSGYYFEHTSPQRHVWTSAGNFLVPRSADDLPEVPIQHVTTIEDALYLLADLLTDRDHRLFMGDSKQCNEAADIEANALRRLAGGELRAMLRVALQIAADDLTDEQIARVRDDESLSLTVRCAASAALDPSLPREHELQGQGPPTLRHRPERCRAPRMPTGVQPGVPEVDSVMRLPPPIPMSADERNCLQRETVARIHAACDERPSVRLRRRTVPTVAPRTVDRPPGAGKAAAHALHRDPARGVNAVAQEYDVNPHTVYNRWRDLYPGEPFPRGKK